jgi:hypothetical protein
MTTLSYTTPWDTTCNGIARLFLAVGGVLVNPDRRGVDHLDIAIVSG